jgi:hypothetical protein
MASPPTRGRGSYESLSRIAIHTVEPDNIAAFLDRKLVPQFEGEMGNRFNVRIKGTRIKHTMGPCSLKLYDKSGLMLRIEATVNDSTFFNRYREVEHRDVSRKTNWETMQKTIYSLPALRELLQAANDCYLVPGVALHHRSPRNGRDKLDKLSQPVEHEGRRYPGFNFFDESDDAPFQAIARGEFNISGLQNNNLRRCLAGNCVACPAAFAGLYEVVLLSQLFHMHLDGVSVCARRIRNFFNGDLAAHFR